MAILTDYQKLFIRENIRCMSIDEVAFELKVKRHLVYQYAYRKGLIRIKKYSPVKFEKVIPDKPKQEYRRPEPVYNNIKSPYGIATQLKEELSLICPGMLRMILR